MISKQKPLIIGSGFIAKKFRKYSKFFKKNGVIIYAAGISNSLETNTKNFKKEINRFEKFYKSCKKKIIYISTYSVNDYSRLSKRYVKNKIKIEKIITKKVGNYLIIRLPEIVGNNNNPHTLTNFLYNNIKYEKKFNLFINTKRNLLDVDDAISKAIKLIKVHKYKNKIVNLLNKKFYSPNHVLLELEKILRKKAIYKVKKINKSHWRLKINHYVKTDKNYLKRILKRYYK